MCNSQHKDHVSESSIVIDGWSVPTLQRPTQLSEILVLLTIHSTHLGLSHLDQQLTSSLLLLPIKYRKVNQLIVSYGKLSGTNYNEKKIYAWFK